VERHTLEDGYDCDSYMMQIVYEAYRKPFTLKSNFARSHTEDVARAASLGLISCIVNHGSRTFIADGHWRITKLGLETLAQKEPKTCPLPL
jgi:hypothetical protein